MKKTTYYDFIVVGGGHAGIEAVASGARRGLSGALITLSEKKIGWMPCNPAIGGIGKGHIVAEISAFGGVMPLMAEKTYLQANMLNRSKGPAVQGLRVQIDKALYAATVQSFIKAHERVTVIENEVVDLIIDSNDAVQGVVCADGAILHTPSVIITTGTFLNGIIHEGLTKSEGGQQGERSTKGIAAVIKKLGFLMGRMKTGTPPRIFKKSITFTHLEEQTSHDLSMLFGFYPHKVVHRASCFITATNENTHAIIRANAHLSPIYQGEITGVAPRYCPSIEDKITRFSHKNSHQIFLEPEGLSSDEIYPNGISTSLPRSVQEEFLRTIPGLERAEIARPGYAIEYDFVYPDQLQATLETKKIKGLFFAGQINGTTGYEEAAGQGLVAGVNASLTSGEVPFIIERHEGYIGVMIHDLVTVGVNEPYRMFTSRAGHRLRLRKDSVFYRLYEKARSYRVIDEAFAREIAQSYQEAQRVITRLREEKALHEACIRFFSQGEVQRVEEIVQGVAPSLTEQQKEFIVSELLYDPYLKREERDIMQMNLWRAMKIPQKILYEGMAGLSKELQQKLTAAMPLDIAHASMIPGMTPAALSLLIFKIKEG